MNRNKEAIQDLVSNAKVATKSKRVSLLQEWIKRTKSLDQFCIMKVAEDRSNRPKKTAVEGNSDASVCEDNDDNRIAETPVANTGMVKENKDSSQSFVY